MRRWENLLILTRCRAAVFLWGAYGAPRTYRCAYQFFESASFRMSMSKSRSARSRFKRAFSRSSSRSLLTSTLCIPWNFFFQV